MATRLRYAVMFIVNLAHADTIKHKTSTIIQNQSLSKGYLEQIIVKLKKTGLIRATKGPGGKYSLNIAPNLITINLILEAIGEKIKITRCEGDASSKSCLANHSQQCNTHNLWSNIEYCIRNYLSNISIKDILSNNFKFNANNHNYIYADYNATSSINPIIKQQLSNMLLFDNIYNPSSMHHLGQKTRKIIEDTREIISKKLNAQKHHVVFTSSGTEANNLVFSSTRNYRHIISATEHLSVMNSAISPIIIPVNQDGIVSLSELVNILQKFKNEKILVSVMLANNETGVIQPVKEIVKISHEFGAIVHTDAIQACGKIQIDVSELGVDLLTISSHKIGGLSGAGVLLYNNSVSIYPTILGGSQERGLRAGTENVASIYSLLLSLNNIDDYVQKMNYIKNLRNKLECDIMKLVPSCKIFGKNVDRLPNTTCIAMPGVSSEVQLMKFDQNNIAVGIGSACSSGKVDTSHVLSAMNVNEQLSKNAIRISLGFEIEDKHIKKIVDCWYKIYLHSQMLNKSSLATVV
ncbi:rrf2 family protein [Candidatus Neoehrlichia lotoris str. RAC413]|uniref:cysteine desulfurase n=2 Tax=Candidatus Neoehrlichia procyonis TaxID=467750 RepID=A0A0F3NLA7_9RICK|nr:rrf2 family protein [Candidatus Neoehrlichia lotoris str. RAC413]